jgi:hypothetical protein
VVELMLTLLTLYGLQCVVLLPRGASFWLVLGSAVARVEGPGWRVLHPWPSAWSWPAAAAGVVRTGNVLHTLGPTPWLGAGFAIGDGPGLTPGGGQRVEVRHTRVLIDGAPAMRGLDPNHAAELGALCRALAADGADVEALLDAAMARSLDIDSLETRHALVSEATRWLAKLSDVSVLALFALLPGMSLWLGGERALMFFAPGYLALHLAGMWLLARAHRRLHPDSAGERFEAIFAASLYPPLLLRGAQDLRRRELSGFHPAAVAVAALPADSALDCLREWITRARTERERAGITDLIERLGSTTEQLLAAPPRSDPMAMSYCASCRTEYRLASGCCSDCGANLEPFGESEPSRSESRR